MGRWAQAKRRASALPTAPVLPAPGQCAVTREETTIYLESSSPGNSGGYFKTYTAPDSTGPWAYYGDVLWGEPAVWGEASSLPASWLAAREVGNGSTYLGEGPLSVAFDNR